MTVAGYSDVINHALAFAAKHHDRQVRKGTKVPYLTHPANIAVILTRYGRDSDTVVAGILHDVIEDCVRDGYTREMLEQRIGDKFGEKDHLRLAENRGSGDSLESIWRGQNRNRPLVPAGLRETARTRVRRADHDGARQGFERASEVRRLTNSIRAQPALPPRRSSRRSRRVSSEIRERSSDP